MITLRDIHKRFGEVKALQGIDLTVEAGTIHGIIGENGAGKSTLMKILTGFISRTSGTITIDGRDVALSSPEEARRQRIGMLYQEPLDFPQLTVLDNFMAAAKDGSPVRQKNRFAGLCKRFGFTIDPAARQGSLTIGERQQVELMRLIRDQCRILILDEPTTGISETQQELLFAALDKLREEGKAVLLVSHKLAEIHALCDRVTVLRHGRQAGFQQRPFDEQQLLKAMFDTLPERNTPPTYREAGKTILEMDQVCSDAGRVGLDRVSIRIGEGEIVGLAGLDGSGQSVFLQTAYGLLKPGQGKVFCPAREEKRGALVFLPADRLREGLIAGLTIREHHILGGKSSFFLTSASGKREAEQAIAGYTIVGSADTPAQGLSGGNQQRLLLSLIPEEARLILLENPTRGLDVQSGQWTWQNLRRRLPHDGAIVFASPDLEEIMEQSTRILVFFNGRIILDQPTSQTDYQEVSRAVTGQTEVCA